MKSVDCDSVHQVGESIALYNCLRCRRTDILYVGESSLDVGEQGVGETTSRRNNRLPYLLCKLRVFPSAMTNVK